MKNKYLSYSKAIEYAKMSWPELGFNNAIEPFYQWVSDLIKFVKSIEKGIEIGAEIGFGAGRIIIELKKIFPNMKVDGFEYSTAMKIISEKILLSNKKISLDDDLFITGKNISNITLTDSTDVQNLSSIENNKYDLTVCINVLDRVINTKNAIFELYRITQKNKYCIIVNAFDYEEQTPVEMQLSPKSFENYLTKIGFKILLKEKTNLVKSLPGKSTIVFSEYGYVLKKIF